LLLNIQQLQCLNPEYPTAAISLNKKKSLKRFVGTGRPQRFLGMAFWEQAQRQSRESRRPGRDSRHAKFQKNLESLNLCHARQCQCHTVLPATCYIVTARRPEFQAQVNGSSPLPVLRPGTRRRRKVAV